MTEGTLTRYRLHFHKTRELRYIGHLDLHRSLERTLRRTKLPLDYSKGFNPRVKLNLSTALPLGCSSTTELADFWLLSALDEEAVLLALQTVAAPGLLFNSLEKIDLRTPSLQSQITAVTYQVELFDEAEHMQLEVKVPALLKTVECTRTRRGKKYDLRPLIQTIEVIRQPSKHPSLRMVLKAGEGMTGRPEEVLLELGIDPAETMIERTHLFLAE
jgi:radical SAM-linked protein